MDVLWNFQMFTSDVVHLRRCSRSDEEKGAYENLPLADELRDEIIDLAEPPPRTRPTRTSLRQGRPEPTRATTRNDVPSIVEAAVAACGPALVIIRLGSWTDAQGSGFLKPGRHFESL